jgi:elongation factor G
MDKERANFQAAVSDLVKAFGVRAVPVVMPHEEGPEFKSIVDLITMKLNLYKDDLSGACEVKEVPPELSEKAQKLREQMVEAIVETDDTLMEKYLEGGEVTEEELKKGLREGVLTKKFIPVLCGSAYNNMGINLLMDMINDCLPSPIERGPVKASDPKSGEEVSRAG